MDKAPNVEKEIFSGFEEEFIAVGISAFSDVDKVNLGKELLERVFKYKLTTIAVESQGIDVPDFIQYNDKNQPDVIVDIKGWTQLSSKYYSDLDAELKKIIEVFRPRVLVFLVFHFIDRDLESELSRSITAFPLSGDLELQILDIYWVVRMLRENRDLEKKYFKRKSILDLLDEPETGSAESVKGKGKIIRNELKKAIIDNDGADYKQDLLGFENDLRAFASTIALRETKPPLAIALMGHWGTGKSFFMHGLEQKVDYLSKYQRFSANEPESNTISDPAKKPYCEGIVQIKFNAWSYLDANLWAGLVVNIYEKLDQYITERSKGEEEKIKAQKKLSEKLAMISDEKENLLSEGSQLKIDKKKIEEELEKLKKGTENLYQSVITQSVEDLKKEAKKKAEVILSEIRVELGKYGLTDEKIERLSPSDLLEEARSWIYFFRNFMKFNTMQKAVMGVILLLLLYLWLFPLTDLLKIFPIKNIRVIGSMITVAAPILLKLYNTLRSFRKLISPLKEYRDQFNKSFDEIKMEYDKTLVLLRSQISEREARINEIEKNLKEAESKMEYYNYALKHSITKRAFTSFIQERSHDTSYQNYLGLISIIRRDFEVLSELFREFDIPGEATEAEQEELVKKKKESDEFRDNFTKPLERIVLYIDDLDRCPDEKVMEVLQAVHLLMAYPLFIVVVGVDKRCVYNALNYKNLIQYSRYTESKHPEDLSKFGINIIQPYEYLEKIFQISFHLKEATNADIVFMINSLLDKQVEASSDDKQGMVNAPLTEVVQQVDGRAVEGRGMMTNIPQVGSKAGNPNTQSPIAVNIEDLKISAKELSFLRDISWLAGNRPRTIKRFINIYRLIRTHEQLSYNSDERENDFLTIMFILGLVLGPYKNAAHGLFKNLETRTNNKLSTSMLKNGGELEFIKNEITQNANIRHLLNFKGSQFKKYLPFIRRFSFEYEDKQ